MNQTYSLPLDAVAIQKLLPHRYPFLLVDRVVEMEANARILAYKNVTHNEPFFTGHFPGKPIMPGVLIIEALAQAGGLLTQLSHQGQTAGRMFYMVKVENARFKRMVVPGDRLDLQVRIKRLIRNMALYEGIASVDGAEVACAEVLCAEDRG
ncbi:MAG: 3-hydroxyacyl-ACP dehydratase FabZ [Oxalobacteraceae bacterium]|nr:MAG: 3-hydroxyacyl-ACP dehydratase FabZ [Oxalobacteraceae bacterium]